MVSAGPYGRYLEFCSAFSPVLACHLLVPTMAAAAGRETPSVVAFPLSPAQLERHFVYSREALKGGRWWTAVSYMFYHADWTHLASNAQGLLLSGPAALEILGIAGALGCYACAGVLGALDLLGIYDLQLERLFSSGWRSFRSQLDALVDLVLPSQETWAAALRRRETKAVTELCFEVSKSVAEATRALDGAAARLATSLATDLASARRLIGASAGVSAFLALDACAAVEQCCGLLAARETPVEAFSILLHAIGAARYFVAEASRAWQGAMPGVDHAAHLNGAVCGFLAYAIARACRIYRRRRRRRIADHFNTTA